MNLVKFSIRSGCKGLFGVGRETVKGGRAIIWPLSFTSLTRLRKLKALSLLKSSSLGFFTMNIATNIKQLFMSEKLLRLSRKTGTSNNPHSPSVDSGLLSAVLSKS